MITNKGFIKLEKREYSRFMEYHLYDEPRTMKKLNVHTEEFFKTLGECKVINVSTDITLDDLEVYCSKDKNIVNINICSGEDKAWEEYLLKCKNLKYLEIGAGVSLDDKIIILNELKYLSIKQCYVENIIEKICEMKALEVLILQDVEITVIPEEICNLKHLQVLSLMHNPIKELPTKISKLADLKYLGLNGTHISKIPNEVMELKKLESLYLGQTSITELPKEIIKLEKLEHLAIWETNLSELPEFICNLKNLKGLYLGRTSGVKELPKRIGDLRKLEKLFIDGTGIEVLPASFKNLVNMKELTLANTKIQKIPEVNEFTKLITCDLRGMSIEKIPRGLINSKIEICIEDKYEEKGIFLKGTKLLCQPISLFEHEKDFIYAYYDEEKIHLNESKIVFLGDGESGKSHIIRRIYEEGVKVDAIEYQATPGIDIVSKICTIDEEQMNLQLWDFGGQDILHSMHRFFLTDRTLYIIVINARDNTQNERARYWLNNVKSFANGCPVILVLNKMDQNPSAGLNETLLKDDYPQIKEIIKMSALEDEIEKFKCLTEKIFDTIKTFDSYAMEFPVSWNRIKRTLTEMSDNYIVDQNYRKLCKENGVDDTRIQNWLLEWFHDLGVSFNYRKKDEFLGGYMVLKPQWITNAIYIILFNAKEYANNGVISKKNIVNLLENPPKAVEDITYNISEVPYIINVLRRFDISYKIDDEYEFMPMLCDENEHEAVKEFIVNSDLEYFMEYQYLPNNVLHKLMIRMRDDLQTDKLWLTGMMLKSRENHMTAVVRIHERRLEIFVKSDNFDIALPKEYLSEIRGHLSRINRELGLDAVDMIVYKEQQIREEIRYDDLLIYLKAGKDNYFSTLLRKEIPVKDIFKIVEMDVNYLQWLVKNKKQFTEDKIRFLLLDNFDALYMNFERELVACCSSLQGNYLERIIGTENDKNTYLRDLLKRNKNYTIYDQTLNGSSYGGKAAGELDLKICINRNGEEKPLAILEALNLDSIQSNYLKQHIDKIYNYDTWGAKRNYLVIYAQAPDFGDFCGRYQNFLENFEFPLEVVNSLEERELEFYSEIRLYDTLLIRNGKETTITHVIINMNK